MPIHVVVTCRCGWKTEAPLIGPTQDIFGRPFEWRDAKIKKCKGCGYDHGVRVSIKEESTKRDVRSNGLPARTDAQAPRRRKGRPLERDIHLTPERIKPWLSLGMSRRTWYRRQKEAKQ